MKRFGRLTFATKLIIVYICSLFFVICMVTVNQIHAAAAVLEQESAQNLQMLTEQIALNFRENQQSLGYTIYSRMAALEIPTLMDEYSQGLANTTLADVRYALAQMITESTDYDYILLELSDSTRVNASSVEIADPRTIRENCDTILDEHRMVTYGNSNWYRGTDGGGLHPAGCVCHLSPSPGGEGCHPYAGKYFQRQLRLRGYGVFVL